MGRLLIRGEPGHDHVPELYPQHNEPVIDKPGRGAFAHTDFDLLLRNKGIKNLILVGVTTDVCVSTTMREAADRGYDCVILEDGCASGEMHLHVNTLETVKTEGGIFGAVSKIDDAIGAVENFKAITAKKSTNGGAGGVGTGGHGSPASQSPATPSMHHSHTHGHGQGVPGLQMV